MKERIVIEVNEKDVSDYNDNRAIIFNKDEGKSKIEQVPESWEELKELCKGITVDVKVCKDGTVYCYEHCIAKNRTPTQMWVIIKNLVGEE